MGDETGFAGRLGIRPERADDGRAHVRFQAAEEHLNPAGTVHGGVLAQAPSQGPAASVRAVGGEGVLQPATSQLTATYLRPGKPGTLTVTAQVRTRGVHLAVCDADVEQDGRAIAHAVATFALLHGLTCSARGVVEHEPDDQCDHDDGGEDAPDDRHPGAPAGPRARRPVGQ